VDGLLRPVDAREMEPGSWIAEEARRLQEGGERLQEGGERLQEGG